MATEQANRVMNELSIVDCIGSKRLGMCCEKDVKGDGIVQVRKPQQRVKRKALGQVQHAAEMDSQGEAEQQEADKNMEEMWLILGRLRQADLLALVLSHESFAQTVENMFALSFLVQSLWMFALCMAASTCDTMTHFKAAVCIPPSCACSLSFSKPNWTLLHPKTLGEANSLVFSTLYVISTPATSCLDTHCPYSLA